MTQDRYKRAYLDFHNHNELILIMIRKQKQIQSSTALQSGFLVEL